MFISNNFNLRIIFREVSLINIKKCFLFIKMFKMIQMYHLADIFLTYIMSNDTDFDQIYDR